ncbi:RNA polymerase sigma factor [Sphingosinicella sp. CPCC 101087]|uniref:RNA polymerase sigma factor n=1 Tax=Sphingosinicella sp. CPCC 101087 TaxID=2497754 RepID=UPI00101C2C75|nr:sigma-70 family RNA polymerase sigma factor [Sphingosinicella sp. CPCC 101087]
MVDDFALNRWFCGEVLPLERVLTAFIHRNWRVEADLADLRQEIYERALMGARSGLPQHTRAYLYTIARNHLINRAKRAQIVSIDLVADLERLDDGFDRLSTERVLDARDELRRVQRGLEALPPRCREVVRLRKVEGLSTREVAQRMGIGTDTVEKQMTLGMRALVDFMLGGAGRVRRHDGGACGRKAVRP